MTAGPANAPAALIQANVRSLVCADRVEANRHDYADALPAVMDPEGTTAAAARTYRLPTAARRPLVWGGVAGVYLNFGRAGGVARPRRCHLG